MAVLAAVEPAKTGGRANWRDDSRKACEYVTRSACPPEHWGSCACDSSSTYMFVPTNSTGKGLRIHVPRLGVEKTLRTQRLSQHTTIIKLLSTR